MTQTQSLTIDNIYKYTKSSHMKQLLTFIALVAFSACYTPYPRYYDPNPSIQRPPIQDRWWWYQDPIYFNYPAPYYYRQPIIVAPSPRVVVPRAPQQPRQHNVRPQQPSQPRSSQAPIRTFPKRDNEK
jgi:hypothetical protein